AYDDALVGMFAALDFGDSDGGRDRSGTESALQVNFHGDRAGLREAIEQAVVFVREKRRRNVRRFVGVLGNASGHVEEVMGLAAVAKDRDDAGVGEHSINFFAVL